VLLLGFVRAVKQFLVNGRVVYASPNRDLSDALRSAARQKYDLIIVGAPFVGHVDAVAGEFPDVEFFMPDAPVAVLEHRRANVGWTLFRAEEAGYLAGYLGALMEARRPGRHVVGSVGGVPYPGVERWIAGFAAGARRADPRVTVLKGYSQDFANPEKCETVALSQIARGSGVVFNVAGGCGLGALAAAKQEGVWGVGVDIDQSFLGRHILTSALMHLDRSVGSAIGSFVDGTFKSGGDLIFDLRNDGVGLGKISPQVPTGLLRRVNALRRQIVAGQVVVPRVT